MLQGPNLLMNATSDEEKPEPIESRRPRPLRMLSNTYLLTYTHEVVTITVNGHDVHSNCSVYLIPKVATSSLTPSPVWLSRSKSIFSMICITFDVHGRDFIDYHSIPMKFQQDVQNLGTGDQSATRLGKR